MSLTKGETDVAVRVMLETWAEAGSVPSAERIAMALFSVGGCLSRPRDRFPTAQRMYDAILEYRKWVNGEYDAEV